MASPSTSVMASPSTSTMSESNNVGGPETITTYVLQPLDNSLQTYLRNSSDGRISLLSYANRGKLTRQHRNSIAHLVIARERDSAFERSSIADKIENFKISPQRFIELAMEIVSLFPTEKVGTYYTAYRRVNGRPCNAHGKLLDRHQYIRKCLKADGILCEPTTDEESNDLGRNVVELEDEDLVDQDDENLIWLQNNIEPAETITTHWSNTFAIRRKQFSKQTPTEYFDLYSFLSLEIGINLINIDFEKLYPSKIEEFRSRWNGNLRAAFIKVILQNKKLLLSLTPEFLEAWTGINNLPEDQQDAIILQTIPFLVKPITSGKRKRNETAFRPSATEIADDFIIRVETPNEVKTAVEKKKKEYLDQKRTVQPFMIFVGSYTQIESFYALINDHYYTFTSALDAVIFTFSSFYVLDLEYPAAAKNVWLLLQIAAYNITHKVDKIGTQLSVLITDLQ